MWSVVEKTALAEAEIEYEDMTSDTIFTRPSLSRAMTLRCVIWTTTPWTIPGNRAIAFSRRIAYGRYRVTDRRQTIGRGPEPPIFSHSRLPRAFSARRE